MDNDTKPPAEEQIKTIPRKARGRAVYRPPAPPVDAAPKIPLPSVEPPGPAVAYPEIGEHDLQVEFKIELRTRMGIGFKDESQATLPGLLDPENRGHMARLMERRFDEMRDLAVQGVSRLIEKNLKLNEPKVKSVAEELRANKKFQPAGLVGGSAGEPTDDKLAPLPRPPGTFHPILNPVPPSNKN